MNNPQRYKKGALLFSAGIILNLLVSAIIFTGASFLTDKGTENSKQVVELTKEKGLTIVENLYSLYKGSSGDVRDDSELELKMLSLYDALDYDLTLSFNIPDKSINGINYMQVRAETDTLRTIYVNLYNNMKVNSIGFQNMMRTGINYNKARDIQQWENVTFTQTNNYIIINLGEGNVPMKGDLVALKIDYSGKPVKKGFDSFSFKEIYGNMYIYTLSEPTWGPVWWPSKDFPDDKATMSMHLIVPTGMKGVSNGLLTDTVQNSDGTTTFNWESKYPIATYLECIVVGKMVQWEDTYTSIDGTKQMPVMYFAFPKDSAKARVDWKPTPEMIKYYSETFGEYPFIDEKYGLVQFGWTSGAMEHQTITSYGYLLVTGDNRYDFVAAHELAHHWFGDAVTLKDWKNIWLNEGFASYSESLWKEHTGGKTAYFDHMKGFDYGYFSGTVYDPKGFIDNPAIYATIYQKGAWVLHMLRGVLGDELFFKAVRAYYEKYKYSNAETSQLVEVFEEYYGSKLDWFFDQWVYKGTGRPKYEYSWKFEDFQGQKGSGAYTVRLQLKQVQKEEEVDLYKMPVKVTIVTEAGDKEFTVFNDTRDQSFLLTVDSTPKEVLIDKDGWILKKVAKGTYEK
ncbi:MAG: M1 family metallopeptidase [Ignavibacteria bacterium]|nr:M1 family metallopeptidase [Ignavibacteria bacterium]